MIGSGIGTSLSPALHEAEGQAQGLDLTYTLFESPDLGRALDDAERDGFAGVNITHPFKQQVIGLLDDLSPQARAIGAVNTVVFRDGKRFGHNTDAYGFFRSFRANLPDVPVRHVVQLGAGGAGAAVAHALLELGATTVDIIDPDATRSRDLSQQIGQRPAGDLYESLQTADGLINTSPIGMHHHPGIPLPAEHLNRNPDLWVADIVYMPVETELLRAARAAGLRTLGGTAMCAYQAAAAFQLFTGTTPDIPRMLRHLDVLLQRRG
ncbi:shikimate dehydrogenase [Actinoplanes sp. OR16]|nr:shikimate dehydrogenase [Actinoplanes sp. OR16]